jgi:hypothetical protein
VRAQGGRRDAGDGVGRDADAECWGRDAKAVFSVLSGMRDAGVGATSRRDIPSKRLGARPSVLNNI